MVDSLFSLDSFFCTAGCLCSYHAFFPEQQNIQLTDCHRWHLNFFYLQLFGLYPNIPINIPLPNSNNL